MIRSVRPPSGPPSGPPPIPSGPPPAPQIPQTQQPPSSLPHRAGREAPRRARHRDRLPARRPPPGHDPALESTRGPTTGAAPVHVRHRLPRAPRRGTGLRAGHVGLARPGTPLERRARSTRRWAGRRANEQDRALIQKDFSGPVTIAFINPKGGAAKTTGVLAAGYTFGTVRGGGVVAWDNNETRGTLGIRGSRSSHKQHHQGAAGRPREVRRREPVPDRGPRLLRAVPG